MADSSRHNPEQPQSARAFWWSCMQAGASGSAPFANDWQWAIGNPTIAAISPAALAGFAAWFGKDYVTAEHPIIGPFVIALGAYVVTWLAAFIVRTLKAAPQLYYRERNRADAFATRFEPKILLDDGIVSEYPTHQAMPAPVPPEEVRSKWVQITITPATDAPLVDCETRLISVNRINDDGTLELIEREPIWCNWSNLPALQTQRYHPVSHNVQIYFPPMKTQMS